jgi:hypothetical protein
MDSANQRRVPLGVLLIAGFYAFGAIVLVLSIRMNPARMSRVMAERHMLSPSIGRVILPAVAALGVAVAYGLHSLSRCGFFLTISYLIYFGGAGLALGGLHLASTGEAAVQLYFGNTIWSMLVVSYLVVRRKHFLPPKKEG